MRQGDKKSEAIELGGSSSSSSSSSSPATGPVLLSIFIQKGGVGKTTSTFNIGALLAKVYGMKVLLVDGDPQLNLTGQALRYQFLQESKNPGSKSKAEKDEEDEVDEEESEEINDEIIEHKMMDDENVNDEDGETEEDEEEEEIELIFSDRMHKLYQRDRHFFEPEGETAEQKEKREQKRNASKTNNLYRALTDIFEKPLDEDKGLATIEKETADKTVIKKLESLDSNGNLFLLPGSMSLFLIDNKITSYAYGAADSTTKRKVFSPCNYVRALAEKHGFDIVLIDLSPNIGGLNQTFLLFGDYFMMPGMPQFFTNQALYSLSHALPAWTQVYSKINSKKQRSKFVSVYLQKVKKRSNKLQKRSNIWVNKITKTVTEKLIPVLKAKEMTIGTLSVQDYAKIPHISDLNRCLPDAEMEGLPISCYNSYPGSKIYAGSKGDLGQYQREFLDLVTTSIGRIVKTDVRLSKFINKFQLGKTDIPEIVSGFLGDIAKTDFSALNQEECGQEVAIAADDFYPQSISSMLRFLYALKQRKHNVHITYPYAFPQEAELKAFKNEMTAEVKAMKESSVSAAVIPLYANHSWTLMVIVFEKPSRNKKNKDKNIEEMKFIIFSKELSRNENPVISALHEFFYNSFDQDRPGSPPDIKIDNGKHPVNVMIDIAKKYASKPRRRAAPFSGSSGSSRRKKPQPQPSTIRQDLLRHYKVYPKESKGDPKEFEKRKALHDKYVNALIVDFSEIQKQPSYMALLNSLIVITPQLKERNFSALTKMVILNAINYFIHANELEGNEHKESSSVPQKKHKKGEDPNDRLLTFLGLLLGRVNASDNSSNSAKKTFAGKRSRAMDEEESGEEDMAEISFIRHRVDADGACGYTAFGITREEAYHRLQSNINIVRSLVRVAVKEALLKPEFVDSLQKKKIISSEYKHVVENIDRHADDLNIISAYIDYDVRDKNINVGWAHPGILQALAHIRGVELKMWHLEDGVPVPHRGPGFDYAEYKPGNATQTTNLLFVNNNHFELIEFPNQPLSRKVAKVSGDIASDRNIASSHSSSSSSSSVPEPQLRSPLVLLSVTTSPPRPHRAGVTYGVQPPADGRGAPPGPGALS